jgi:SSS family solute:Na+ symporter
MRGTPLDFAIVIIYFVGILAFGSYFSRFSRTTHDFFYGGQRFAWWLIAASLVATGIGSYSFIKYSQAGFNHGMSSTITYLNDWFVIPFFMFGWLPIIYFARIKSVPEYFERRFGKGAGLLATVFIFLYLLGYIGLNFYLLGLALRAVLGINLYVAVIVVAVISAIYLTAGGQTAVIFTDLIQGVFLYAAGGLLLFLGLRYVGGLAGWWEGMDLAHRLPFPGFSKPADFNFVGIFWSEGIVGTLAFTFINQGFIMRYLAIKSVNEGRKCLVFNTLILMPISAIVVGNVGWMAYSAVTKGTLPLPEGFDTRDIFIHAAEILTSPGVFGFVIAALTAALMSTADTLINAVAAIGVFDLYKPYVKPEADDRHYLRVARFITLGATLVGVLLVPAFTSTRSIIQAHYAFVGMVTPPMLVAIFLGILWKRFSPAAAFWSMILGSVAILISVPLPQVIDPLADLFGMEPAGAAKYLRSLYGLAATLIFAVALTPWTRPKARSELVGLTLGTLREGMARFKGGEPSYAIGRPLRMDLEPTEEGDDLLHLPSDAMERLRVREGDMLYIADAGWYFGGLRSAHAKAGAPAPGSRARLRRDIVTGANLKPSRRVRVEKIL